MENSEKHITPYSLLAKILVILLFLTFITVAITGIHLGPLTVAVALIIASVKVALVLIYFMHLKYESRFLQLMVSGVFLLFALVIVITFIDYLLR
ncbi:MAG: cytochrome C oxidase subunit IV family protein [Bacteroidales bacterium]